LIVQGVAQVTIGTIRIDLPLIVFHQVKGLSHFP
jgi:hypothetical protein